jgi:hypothetical protein
MDGGVRENPPKTPNFAGESRIFEILGQFHLSFHPASFLLNSRRRYSAQLGGCLFERWQLVRADGSIRTISVTSA